MCRIAKELRTIKHLQFTMYADDIAFWLRHRAIASASSYHQA
ncbi:unnamed protein product [Ixodes pacificus]